MHASPPATPDVDPALADALTHLVARAGARILTLAGGPLTVTTKSDLSPVTGADLAANAILIEGLARLLPGVPVVSEEAATGQSWGSPETFVLVDPLDGTKEFVAGRPEYSVNLAIVTKQRSVAGFIALPAAGQIYRGIRGRGAERLTVEFGGDTPVLGPTVAVHTRPAPASGLVAAVSRSHLDAATEAFLTRPSIVARLTCGSAVKFCRVAEGEADVYPRLSPTSEWDIAAGHALIEAAGGIMSAGSGAPLTYGHAEAGFLVDDFIAWGDPEAARAA